MRVTPSQDFFIRVATGEIPGLTAVYKFGRVEGISLNNGSVVVWNNGGDYTFPDANGTLSIVSASDDDAVGQGGATEISINGLVNNSGEWEEQTITKTLTGTTPVVTTEEFIRVNRMWISAGEDRNVPVTEPAPVGANHGKITVTHSDTGVPISVISANQGQTLQAVYTVPSGYLAYILDADANIGEAADGIFRFLRRENVTGNEVFRISGTREAFQTEVGQSFKTIAEIKAKTDIIFMVATTKNDKNASATFQLILKEV